MKIRRAVARLAVDRDLFALGVLAAASCDIDIGDTGGRTCLKAYNRSSEPFNLAQEGGQASPTFPMNGQVFMALRSALMTSTQESVE